MIVVTKLPNGLDLGDGVIVRGAMLGHEDHQKARAPGRERVAGYEVTRGVPDDAWRRWLGENARGPIVQRRLVAGFADGDEQAMSEFCWANRAVRGWARAPQG